MSKITYTKMLPDWRIEDLLSAANRIPDPSGMTPEQLKANLDVITNLVKITMAAALKTETETYYPDNEIKIY